jgi:outer membrane protein
MKRSWPHVVLAISWLTMAAARAEEGPRPLTLKEAQEIALQRHPRITAAELRALAAREVTREVRSSFFPQVYGHVTAVGTAEDNTRIAAGALNNPAIFERAAAGVSVSMLLFDFGRTSNLTESARLRALAADKGTEATRDLILLDLNRAYFSALQAQSVLSVAQQTVDTRQLLVDQVTALAANKLKSDLDVSFARVSLEEGKLLLARAQNDLKSSFASLSTLLGSREEQAFRLVDEPMPAEPTGDISKLIGQALESRPDLARLHLERDAAEKYARAEDRLAFPVISAVGAAGVIPVRDSEFEENYAAAGVNLTLPLFTGLNNAARRAEAEYRAEAAGETLRDEENQAVLDVRIAWQNVVYTYERVGLTQRLSEQATLALNLTRTRYDLGTSSIIDLSQAQLNKTAADIAYANARYDHQIQLAFLRFQIGALR